MTTVAQDEPGSRHKVDPDSPGLVSDCRLMLSFARKNGFVLPPTLVHEIGWLDSVLRALKIPPISQLSAQLIWPIDLEAGPPRYAAHDPAGAPPVPEVLTATATAPDAVLATTTPDEDTPEPPADAAVRVERRQGLTPEEVVLDVHSKLSLLIAPTTALSLQTSEPPAGKRHIFGGMPPIVQYVIVIAFVSATGFAISTAKVASQLQTLNNAMATVDAAAALPTPAAASISVAPMSAGADAAAPSTSGLPADAASPARKAASHAASTAPGAKP